MPYTIYKSDGSQITIADGNIDNMLYNPTGGNNANGMGLQLVGYNVIGYGAAIAQNIVQSAENFANATPPADAFALEGQLWYPKGTSLPGKLYLRTNSNTSGNLSNWNIIPVLDSNGNLIIPGTYNLPWATLAQAEAGVSTTTVISPATLVGTVSNYVTNYINNNQVPVTNNLSGGSAGAIPFQSAANTTTFLPIGNNGNVLSIVNGALTWVNQTVSGVNSLIAGTGITLSSATGDITISTNGLQPSLGFTPVQQGGGTNQDTNKIFIGWSSSSLLLQVDATDFGNIWPISIHGTAAVSTQSSITAVTNNQTYNIPLLGSANSGQQGIDVDGNNNLTWNPGSKFFNVNGTVSATNLNLSGALVTNSIISNGQINGPSNTNSSLTVGFNGESGTIVVNANSTSSAVMTFIRNGAYALNFGLDADNVFRLGGFTQGTNQYRWTSDSSGNFVALGDVTGFSDERVKTNWGDLPDDFLENLVKVKYGTFDRIDTGIRQAGVSAQDMIAVLSEVVHIDYTGNYSLAYGQAAMVAAIKLAERVLALESELKAIKGD